MDQATLFLDTMVYLHFRPIEDIDWPAELGAAGVRIVVPRITVRELDRWKNIHKLQSVRARAARILTRIEEAVNTANKELSLRPNVILAHWPGVPDLSSSPTPLNPDWADDVLLGTIHEYRTKNPLETVILVTQDTGPRLTAHAMGVTVHALRPELALPEELDPVEKENDELRRQLQRLQGVLPRPSVHPRGLPGRSFVRVVIGAPNPRIAARIEETLDAERQRVPEMVNPFGPRAQVSIPGSESESTRYNAKRHEYLESYRRYLERIWNNAEAERRTVVLGLALSNDGTAPADDVTVMFSIPSEVDALIREHLPSPPKKPEPPSAPHDPYRSLMRDLPLPFSGGLAAALGPQPNVGRLEADDKSATCTVKRCKHGLSVDLPEVLIEFASFEAVRSFRLDCSMAVANLAEAVPSDLDIAIERTDDTEGPISEDAT